MAKSETKPTKKPKSERGGTIRQLISVYKMTVKSDRNAIWYALFALVIGVAVGVIAGLTLGQANPFGMAVWILTGTLLGVLSAMIVMSRRAERVAYSQIEGQAGAVGAVLAQVLKRGWSGSEMPVSVNPRTRDAVYRAIGPGGVVLIGEGAKARVQQMLEDEKKKIVRAVPGAPVVFVLVTGDEGSTALAQLGSKLRKLKRVMNRTEISAVSKRLSALGTNLPIPKGIDPMRIRATRR
jgi:F0F1-type ATP synthase assembly protein I